MDFDEETRIMVKRHNITLERDYPEEKLGVADRLILARIIRRESLNFLKEGEHPAAIACSKAIRKGMRAYGFKPEYIKY